MTIEIQLRAATDLDADALSTLLTQLGYPDAARSMALRLPQLLTHPDAELWVAAQQECLCGFISLHFIPQLAMAGDFARISYFCIDEQWRGGGAGSVPGWSNGLSSEPGCVGVIVSSCTVTAVALVLMTSIDSRGTRSPPSTFTSR